MLRTPSVPIRGLAFSPDGTTLLSGGDDKVVRFWDVATRREFKSLPPFKLNIYDMAMSPDGSTFATATGDYTRPDQAGEVKLWDLASGDLLQALPEFDTYFYDVEFTPDGHALVFSDALGKVRFWDIEKHSLKCEIQCDERVRSVELIPGSRLFAASGRFGGISIWDIKSRERLALYEGHDGLTYSLACSPDGTVIASGGVGPIVGLWKVPNAPGEDETIAAQIRRWVNPYGSLDDESNDTISL